MLAITLRNITFTVTLRNITFALGGARKAHLRPPEGPQETPGGPTKGPGKAPSRPAGVINLHTPSARGPRRT